MTSQDQRRPDAPLDARENRKVAFPLMPEFAIVSTLALIAAPIVVVGAAAMAALAKRLKESSSPSERRL